MKEINYKKVRDLIKTVKRGAQMALDQCEHRHWVLDKRWEEIKAREQEYINKDFEIARLRKKVEFLQDAIDKLKQIGYE